MRFLIPVLVFILLTACEKTEQCTPTEPAPTETSAEENTRAMPDLTKLSYTVQNVTLHQESGKQVLVANIIAPGKGAHGLSWLSGGIGVFQMRLHKQYPDFKVDWLRFTYLGVPGEEKPILIMEFDNHDLIADIHLKTRNPFNYLQALYILDTEEFNALFTEYCVDKDKYTFISKQFCNSYDVNN